MSHALQYLIVQADSYEDARNIVVSQLEDSPDWSDWHNATWDKGSFAGRWENTAFNFSGKDDEEIAGVQEDILQYSANPDVANKAIERAIKDREDAIAYYKTKIETNAYDIVEAKYDPYAAPVGGLNNYYYEKLAKILDNDWTSDSFVFDLTNWTASLYDWKLRIVDKPEEMFLVAVDFHY